MGSRAAEVTVKATDAVKSLETQPPRDPGVWPWNVQTVTTGTGEALSGPVTCGEVARATRAL